MFDVYNYGYSYEGLIQSCDVEIILIEEDDDYQGDSLCVLKDRDGKYGFLIFGWGSCSGCDAFQAAQEEGFKALEELRNELWNSVEWFASLDDLRVDLNDRDAKLKWYGHTDLFKKFLGALEGL